MEVEQRAAAQCLIGKKTDTGWKIVRPVRWRVPQSVGQFRLPFGFLPELTGRDTSVRMCHAGCHREFVSGSEA